MTAGLFGGGGLGLGLDDFTDELAQDPARRAVMATVDVVPDERCDAIYPHQFPAVVTLRTTSGEVLVEEVLTNRGGPARPLSDDELGTQVHRQRRRPARRRRRGRRTPCRRSSLRACRLTSPPCCPRCHLKESTA